MEAIWLQLEKETDRAYWDFVVYRDLGPTRSLQKAGKRLAKNAKSLARLSKKYQWRERARAFDAYVDQRKVDAVVNEAVAMHQIHVKIASVTQRIAHAALTELAWRLDNTNYLNYGILSTEKLLELTPKLVKMYGDRADMERLARGFEAKEAEPNSDTTDIRSLLSNPEFLRLFDALIEQKPKGIVSPRQDGTRRMKDLRKERGRMIQGRVLRAPHTEKKASAGSWKFIAVGESTSRAQTVERNGQERRRNMRGSIVKKGNNYYACLWINGKKKWFSGAGTSKRKAEAILTEKLAEVQQGTYHETTKLLFRDFAAQWLDSYAAHRVKGSTLRSYQDIIRNHLVPAFGDCRLTDITTALLQRYVSERLKASKPVKKSRKKGTGKISPRNRKNRHSRFSPKQ